MTASVALRNNIVIYGIGGVIAPFIGIKVIDMVLVLMGVG
jgi:K+-transporting ATPase ATPase B chain